ncbi:unnamed protein product [Acanthoscelides obtectus]|uniref:Uncharacterized protein n=1 Tax=Acanthoscelides obtectus TaxID=200917 RepID=A0A9P0LDI3_ACAOB|nr:unnamed protein product [Acanthoscelides obtectus]CAK1635639.1 hypothetical protein AOBTE_LOCUS9409 [Acanthoscelides obtectus]
MKVLFYATLVLAAIALVLHTANACLSDGEKCVYDPSGQTFDDCCSGFCYQQVGWTEGSVLSIYLQYWMLFAVSSPLLVVLMALPLR